MVALLPLGWRILLALQLDICLDRNLICKIEIVIDTDIGACNISSVEIEIILVVLFHPATVTHGEGTIMHRITVGYIPRRRSRALV